MPIGENLGTLPFRYARKYTAWYLSRKTGLSTQQAWAHRLKSSWYFPKQNVRCVFVPKAGCSSFRLLMLRLANHDPSLNKIAPTYKLLQQELISHHYLHMLHTQPTSIAFVRNPYARLISCYRNKVLGQEANGHIRSDIILKNLPASATTSFANFVQFACQTPDHLRDDHFASQWLTLAPGLGSFDFIGHVEHFTQHARIILTALQAPKAIVESIDAIHANRSGSYTWQDHYTEELANLVYQAYKPDFEAFGYHKEAWRKDSKAPNKKPICNYDPMVDIARFHTFFNTKKTITT